MGSTLPDRLSDAQLVERVRTQRDDRAFEVLYNRHSGLAMTCAMRVVFDRGMAADAVQGAFLDVWRNSGSYVTARGSVSAWIAAITANRAIDILRRARTQERVESASVLAAKVAPEPDAATEAVIERDRSELWRAGVDALPVAQREVIQLAYYEDLSQTEIASRLGVPLGTVKGRVRLGLARLKAMGDRAELA